MASMGNTTVLDGVPKDVFGALSQSLGFEFLVKPEPNGRFGSLQPDGSYSGILGALHSKEDDIGGPFVATEQRYAVVDFTSLEFSSRGIIFAVESVDRNIFLYAKVFSWKGEMHRTLNVRYNVWPPWAMTYVTKNKTVLDGVLKDVFEALSESMEYKFVLELQPDKRFGSLMPDGSFSGMVGALEKKEADLAGPLIGSEERSLVAEFTNYLEPSTLGLITGIEEDEGSTVEYTKILSWQVVLGLIISVIVLTLVSYIMQNVYLENLRFINWKFILSSLIMWCKYLIGKNMSVSKAHSSEKIWYSVSFRILLAAWLLGPVVNLLWTFQGSITSTFAVTKFKPVVGSLGELKKKTHIIPVTTKGSFVQICFRSNPDYNLVWQRMENHTIDFTPESIEKVFGKIEKKTHILIVDYVYALVIASDWVKKTGNCKVQVEELKICKSFISLGLRKGLSTKILRKINYRLNYIMQAKLTDRWMNRVYNNYTHCSKRNVAEIKPLDFTSFRSIFIFWALGIILSIACLSIEMSLRRRIPSQ